MSDLDQNITVKRSEEEPEDLEVIADSIIKISDVFDKISKSRLKERVILLLIRDHTGIGLREIQEVLNAAKKLKDVYLKKHKRSE